MEDAVFRLFGWDPSMIVIHCQTLPIRKNITVLDTHTERQVHTKRELVIRVFPRRPVRDGAQYPNIHIQLGIDRRLLDVRYLLTGRADREGLV